MVYTSSSISLATLETLVHLQDPSQLDHFMIGKLSFDEALVKTFDVDRLPSNWRSPNHRLVQALGDDWVTSGESVILAVPSAIIVTEINYLINPNHPDFPKITIHPFEPYPIDRRLVRD